MQVLDSNGAPGRIRTSDPLVRSQMLYPAELRAHACEDCNRLTATKQEYRINRVEATRNQAATTGSGGGGIVYN